MQSNNSNAHHNTQPSALLHDIVRFMCPFNLFTGSQLASDNCVHMYLSLTQQFASMNTGFITGILITSMDHPTQ